MAAQLSQVEETQRKQITQELHDRVGQNLSAIHILLDTISSRLPPDIPEPIQAELDQTVRCWKKRSTTSGISWSN